MKYYKSLIDISEVKDNDKYVFTGISICGDITKRAQEKIIKLAKNEQQKTHITCYPVIADEGYGHSLYVYADYAYTYYAKLIRLSNTLSDVISKFKISTDDIFDDLISILKIEED